MKDNYSFDLDVAGARRSYNRMFVAYLRTFARLGLKAVPMRADAGPIGGDMSHEFAVLAETGGKRGALRFAPARARRARRSGLRLGPSAPRRPLHRVLRGGGPTATMKRRSRRSRPNIASGRAGSKSATSSISEPILRRARRPGFGGRTASRWTSRWGPTASASRVRSARSWKPRTTEAGIVWPESVAPFQIAMIDLKPDDAALHRNRESLVSKLAAAGVSCSWTTATNAAGVKFATADLIGLPWRLVVGPRGLAQRRRRAPVAAFGNGGDPAAGGGRRAPRRLNGDVGFRALGPRGAICARGAAKDSSR